MTEGQRLALDQLHEIEAVGEGAVEILATHDPELPGLSRSTVEISLYCGDIRRKPEGLPVRDRERVIVEIPPDFPFDIPTVISSHRRFAGFPHVQWGQQLCLYLAPDTEWDASDGMFGFLVRLAEWLKQGARGELDPIGAPLHPPVAYAFFSDTMVIPRVNTPTLDELGWFGAADLNVVSEGRIDVCGWSEFSSDDPPGPVAAAVLLAEALTFFEFPVTVQGLFAALEKHRVPRKLVLRTMQSAVVRNKDTDPLYVLIGSPARGIRGDKELQQHLTAWYVEPDVAQKLRLAILRLSDKQDYQRVGEEAEKRVWKWAADARVIWCTVREDRPEVTVRRDHDAPTSWFCNRVVSIWGCGALGGHIAEFLARAGVRKLVLRDHGSVGPGVLSRQPFDDADLGRNKAGALADRLRRIRPSDLELEAHSGNVLGGPLASTDWTDGAEVVIDATASSSVSKKLERRWAENSSVRVPVVSMIVGHRAEHGLVVLVRPAHSGGPADAFRRAKLAAATAVDLAEYRDEFWPTSEERQERIFQPEPGCSDATFVGSSADLAVLAGAMLNHGAQDLATDSPTTASARFVTQPHRSGKDSVQGELSWETDDLVADPYHDYQIRVSAQSQSEMQRWIKRSQRLRGMGVETGGVLFGERDDAARVVWVDAASGPPPDSESSRTGFLCGTVGTAEINREQRARSRGSVQFIGMWHTHPYGPAEPSDIDREGMARLLSDLGYPSPRPLLLIVGYAASNPTIGAYVYSRRELDGVRFDVARLRRGLLASVRTGLHSLAAWSRRSTAHTTGRWYGTLVAAVRRLLTRSESRR